MPCGKLLSAVTLAATIVASGLVLSAQEKPADTKPAGPSPVTVRMVVMVEAKKGETVPSLSREDALVRQGKNRLKVTEWTPAKGENAGLELFILIDDTTLTDAGAYLDELRTFIGAQPSTTIVGVGYMNNATFSIAQNLTNDHSLAAKALRLPRGNTSAMGSPYLSLIDLVKRWPPSRNRRAVIILTDGIDRLRRDSSMNNPRRAALATMSPDVDSASERAQREAVIVYSVFVQGAGHYHRNLYEINLGQSSQAKLADETGGEFFALGQSNPVSINPYLNSIQRALDNQFLLGFEIAPKKKAGLQTVKIFTEVPNAEIIAANSVWVRAAE